MSWTKKINHPGELLKKGDTVEVKVLDIDAGETQDIARHQAADRRSVAEPRVAYAVGTELASCEVARILDRGVVVNLGNDVEGFIPLNQLGREGVSHPSRIYKVGDQIPAEIVEFDLESRKIVLSVEEYFKDKEALLKEHEAVFPLKPAQKEASRTARA